MNFLCPSCRTPLPREGHEHVRCTACGVAVDLARVETAPGQARLWPEVDLSGESLGGYALVRLLGSGGMGTVYEARAADGTLVALKVLAPLLAAEPALRERFRREARALAAIHHPGVVRMLGEGEERSFCWYAMERVEGEDLRQRLTRGALSTQETVALARAVLDALEAVHAAGFVHRDVKPSNILLSPSGPKLCDFGIARLDGATTLTESAAVLGSLRYMAPEQRWGRCDERSDLYALGVVLHEALALGVPGERTLPSSTPTALVRLITRLTETTPSRRPESAAAARRLLARVPVRDVRVAAAAILLIGLVSAAGIIGLVEPLAPRSANVEPDAGTPTRVEAAPIDAGPSTVVEAAPVDAGPPTVVEAAPVDAGPATVELPVIDAGTRLSAADADAGGPKAGLSKLTSLLVDGPPPKPRTKAPRLPMGVVSLAGVGTPLVSIRGQVVGRAPGKFEAAFGTFTVHLDCRLPSKSKKKPVAAGRTFDFEVTLSSEKPSETLRYDCDAPP
ncbi:MAG: protein kinase domain-containing protein [Myxococcota bacterium]